MNIVGILLTLVLIGLVFWAARALLGAFSIGDPIATVIYVILVVFVVLWLIQTLGYIDVGHLDIMRSR